VPRTTPYAAFNFTVNFNSKEDPEKEAGGFSEVSGLSTEMVMAEYRVGSAKENFVHRLPAGMQKTGDVTLKRGIVDSRELFEWIKAIREVGYSAKRDIIITLRDENLKPVRTWTLRSVAPAKYTGPTLNAKGGDVAMEELVLNVEAFDAQDVSP
jgi:phage tail-like protein